MGREDIDSKKEYIYRELLAGVPRYELCRRLKCKYDTLKARIDKWGYSHLKNPSRKGMQHKEIRKSANYYLENKTTIQSSRLRIKLYEDNLKKEICEQCGISGTWNGKKLVLHLDHKNGDHYDNRLENLRILCPNCHSQTSTWCTGQRGRKRINDKDLTKGHVKGNGIPYPLRTDSSAGSSPVMAKKETKDKTKALKKYCTKCAIEINKKSLTGLCWKCFSAENKILRTKIQWPPSSELKNLIDSNNGNMTKTAKDLSIQFNCSISDNAIRKRLKKYP